MQINPPILSLPFVEHSHEIKVLVVSQFFVHFIYSWGPKVDYAPGLKTGRRGNISSSIVRSGLHFFKIIIKDFFTDQGLSLRISSIFFTVLKEHKRVELSNIVNASGFSHFQTAAEVAFNAFAFILLSVRTYATRVGWMVEWIFAVAGKLDIMWVKRISFVHGG